MKTLYVKDDSGNPTHSFKDRVVAVALDGRAAARLHHGGLRIDRQPRERRGRGCLTRRPESCVFVPSDLEAGKIVTTAVYGGTLVAVEGNYDDVNRLCSEVAADLGWGFVNVNLRPYYAEGSKTRRLRSC